MAIQGSQPEPKHRNMTTTRTPIEIPWKTGKVAVLADLHHDSYSKIGRGPFESHGLGRSLPWAELDALIIAGDLANAPFSNWPAAFAYLRRFMNPSRTVIFPGNHDYYMGFLNADDELEKLADAAGVHFAQQREVRHGDDRYFCTTLWTDFAMLNDPKTAMNVARGHMNDYAQISRRLETGPLLPSELIGRPQQVAITPEDILALHKAQRHWLEDQLAEPHWVPNVRNFVITHHGSHPSAAGQVDELTRRFTLISRLFSIATGLTDGTSGTLTVGWPPRSEAPQCAMSPSAFLMKSTVQKSFRWRSYAWSRCRALQGETGDWDSFTHNCRQQSAWKTSQVIHLRRAPQSTFKHGDQSCRRPETSAFRSALCPALFRQASSFLSSEMCMGERTSLQLSWRQFASYTEKLRNGYWSFSAT